VALAIIGLVLFLLRRRSRQDWRTQARAADAEASNILGSVTRGLATLQDPSAAARTWSDVEARGSQLHGRLQALAARPPDDRSGIIVGRLDQSLQALRAGVEADRDMRLGPPPPTEEQLRYSEAVIRQRAAEYEQAIRELDSLLLEQP
jgi:hypothetical protein